MRDLSSLTNPPFDRRRSISKVTVFDLDARRTPGWLSTSVLITLLRAADVTVVVLAGALAYLTRFGTLEMTPLALATMACVSLLSANSLQVFGLYRSEAVINPARSAFILIVAWLVAISVAIALGFMTKTAEEVSRLWIGLWSIYGLLGLFISHICQRTVVRRLQAAGYLLHNIVIGGIGPCSLRIAAQLRRGQPSNGIRVLGLLKDGADEAPGMINGLPVLGDFGDLQERIKTCPIDQVIIPLPLASEAPLSDWVAELKSLPLDVRLCPDLSGWDLTCRGVGQLGGLPLVDVVEKPITGWQWIAKTVEDRILAVVILLLILPVILGIAVAIKLDSPGPVFFRQKRYGINNELIEVLKFRSMYHGSGRSDSPVLQVQRIDARVTRVGRFLRRTSLDELPQFINVLKGDMSIVGPRPHAVQHNDLYAGIIAGYHGRHRVRPGITGWAQIHGLRGGIETIDKLEERVRFDLFYIDNWSLALDLWIVIRTLKVGFINDNAY